MASLILITGPFDGGKTTELWNLLDRLSCDPSVRLCGFATALQDDKSRYSLINLATEEQRLVLTEHPMAGWERFGRFFVDTTVFSWANSDILSRSVRSTHVVFDEIGRMELQGGGFAPSFRHCLDQEALTVVAVVRNSFLSEVARTFALELDGSTIISCV